MKKETKKFLEISLSELDSLFPSNETLKNYRTHLFYLLLDFEIPLKQFACELGVNVSTIHRFKQQTQIDAATLRKYSQVADKLINIRKKQNFVRKSHRVDISQD
jgi:hypothetical protein